ncbi:MAG: hypothetical protein E7554_02390 [Ruminococcaceae bacterium]|nr:hypothetical protein [Oscillospiraceae bacterium]
MKDPATGSNVQSISGLGVTSAVCALCSYFFLLSAFFGIAFGVVGLMRRRRDVLCWAGIILSAIFLVSGIVTMARLCGSPELESILMG